MTFIFATNNAHKVAEIRAVLPASFQIQSLIEAGIHIDIPEPHDTLEANAREKAETIYGLTGTSCFSEDTGLEVAALGGEPGVRSARYADGEKQFQSNTDKLLQKMEGAKDRSAQFRTVICLLLNGSEHFFEGVCRGRIVSAPKGEGGFGYDPVFVPEGLDKTFAEMSLEEKSKVSHRRKAIDRLVSFLNNGS